MGTLQKYTPFFASALLMCVVLFIIYPHYQYYIDPDGTAYLTISQRYANGDYLKAINGYWSPWSCWLTALLIKAGLSAIPASVIINALGATGFLFISQSFFIHFGIIRKLQWLLNITLAFFLCYAIFWQSFDDLWECFFLLSTLRLMLTDDFKNKPALWVICGVIGTLAYFAKAYSFPFFILNTICCTWFLSRDKKLQWIKISLTAITVMALCSLPWIWALHNKYGIWTTSTAGSLNMSWYLVGHPFWKEGIDVLIAPAYPDSPYYWEDPWFANGATPHFWNSWHLFGLQLLRIGLNILKFIVSSFQLSVFFIVIVGYAKWITFWKRSISLRDDLRVLMLSFLLFTVGYVLVNFEARYLWYMVPLSMVIGGLAIQNASFNFRLSPKLLTIIFPLSYLLIPAWGLFWMYDAGKQEFNLASQLKSANIHGSFTGNISPLVMERVAYFSGNQYYFMLPIGERYHDIGLFKEIQRNKIDYYLHANFINSSPIHTAFEEFNDSALLNENSRQLSEIKIEGVSNVRVFRVN